MQGTIWVTPSREEFDYSLGLALHFHVPSAGDHHAGPQSSGRLHSENSVLRGLRVLLVDADDMNRAVTRKLLEKLGCTISCVSSGHECLAALGLTTASFQVVVLDLQLPDLDGFEVSTRIRKLRSRNWPLIVAVTGNDDCDVVDKCAGAGINGFVQKPCSLHEMSCELRRMLKRVRSPME